MTSCTSLKGIAGVILLAEKTAERTRLVSAMVAAKQGSHSPRVLMQRNEKLELSNLLQCLRDIGAIDHPSGNGGTHRYVLRCWPAIDPA